MTGTIILSLIVLILVSSVTFALGYLRGKEDGRQGGLSEGYSAGVRDTEAVHRHDSDQLDGRPLFELRGVSQLPHK